MDQNTQLSTYFTRQKKGRLTDLSRLGLSTIGDLLYHFPSRYSDGAQGFDGTLTKGEHIHFSGIITSIRMRRSRGVRRVMMAEASVSVFGVNTKRVRLVWFSQPYIAKQYSKGDAVDVAGVVSVGKQGVPYITNPTIKPSKNVSEMLLKESDGVGGVSGVGGSDDANENKNTVAKNNVAPLVSIYPETKGISSLYLRSIIEKLLSDKKLESITDPIPNDILKRLNLPSLYEAFTYIHTPRSADETVVARKRFIFEKIFILQLQQKMSQHEREEASAYKISIDTKQVQHFMDTHFNFTPTKGQINAINDIIKDINKNIPMARLLDGDVGSGKTAVAAAVAYGTITAEKEEQVSGHPQVAYLAPTEILARQQFQTLIDLFKDINIRIGLITSKACAKYPSKIDPTKPTPISKAQLKKWVLSGEIDLLIGTHAIIQKDVGFKRLALVIIDEQHRFGVTQRHTFLESISEHRPHLLSMTATPIPRTLALALYGGLSISVIDTLPKERKPVKTKLLQGKEIQKAYQHIREEVEKGHQAYVICPLVERNEDSILRSVDEEHAYLSKELFPNFTIEKLHGKMKPKEKQDIMECFSNGEVDILVATIVVEVGINVPNATTIVILHSERFGLAQLHQLRGRVRRSDLEPFCYAITDSNSENTLERLREFERTHNGLVLAEKDLELRGSGDLSGVRQSGIPDLVWEGLKNQKLIAIAQAESDDLLSKDRTLKNHPQLKNLVREQQAQGD